MKPRSSSALTPRAASQVRSQASLVRLPGSS
jgi:hypothetical protein